MCDLSGVDGCYRRGKLPVGYRPTCGHSARVRLRGMRRANVIGLFCCCGALVPSTALAMDWPDKLVCTDPISRSCDNEGLCDPLERSKITKALWTFNFRDKAFDISNEFEGKIVPNFSGKILQQHDQLQNPDYALRMIFLDTGQMFTFLPKLERNGGVQKGVFVGVMQFTRPGAASMTAWVTCKSGDGS